MHNIRKQKFSETEVEAIKAKISLYKRLYTFALKKKKDKEYTQSSLDITTKLLQINSNINNIWNFRKEIVVYFLEKIDLNSSEDNSEKKKKILKKELKVIEINDKNFKSYPMWNHREWIIKMGILETKDYKDELEMTTDLLVIDERNFHTWTYRRFLTAKLKISDESEILFTEKKIKENFSNYSAWHYRIVLLEKTFPSKLFPLETFAKEALFAFKAFSIEPKNNSVWQYYLWLLARLVGVKTIWSILKRSEGYTFMGLKGERLEVLREERKKIEELKGEEPECSWIRMALAFVDAILVAYFGREKSGDSFAMLSENVEALASCDPMRGKMYEELLVRVNDFECFFVLCSF